MSVPGGGLPPWLGQLLEPPATSQALPVATASLAVGLLAVLSARQQGVDAACGA